MQAMRSRFPIATVCAASFCLAALGSCSPPRVVPPAPAPVPAPTPTPAPMPTPAPARTPAPAYANWMDAPQSPGDWFYLDKGGFTYAAFGSTASTPVFVMRCDKAKREVSLGRVSDSILERPMRIVTETTTRLLTGQPRQGSIEHLIAADLPSADVLLDAMALSKGRFAVETGGMPTLYLPSWPEVTRVIEDCR